MPNYAVLVDTRDRLIPQLAYVVQENIEIIDNEPNLRIMHNLVNEYFEAHNGKQYVMRPKVKKIYPHD